MGCSQVPFEAESIRRQNSQLTFAKGFAGANTPSKETKAVSQLKKLFTIIWGHQFFKIVGINSRK